MKTMILAGTLVLCASAAAAAEPVAQSELMKPYFGNTFISLHDDGTQYVVYWNADGTFSLTRRGGAEPSAGYTMRGTYTIEKGLSCFHAADAPKGSPGCVPMEAGKSPGTAWDVKGREHEVHMILVGRQP